MFKYFNEEETKKIFENNREFKKLLNEITTRIRNNLTHAFWNSEKQLYFNIPNEISNIILRKNLYAGWFCGTFIRYITNEDKNIILWYICILTHNESSLYRSIYDDDNVIILKGKDYFYIITTEDDNIELFFMPIVDENKDDNIYYKIEMGMTL